MDDRNNKNISASRPVWVWIISAYFMLSVVIGITSQLVAPAAGVELPQKGPLDWAFLVLSWVLITWLSISLFMLRRLALYVSIAVLAFGILNTVLRLTGMDVITGDFLIRLGVSFGVYALITMYIYILARRGVLR